VLKFLEALSAGEFAVSPQLGRKAVEAAARFGRVVGHAADFNFGDRFAYACARKRGASLLFVGNDFTRTDIESALTDPRPAR
jgi:ribonuclease VapC